MKTKIYLDTSSVNVESTKEALSKVFTEHNIDKESVYADCFMKKGEHSDKWISMLICLGVNNISTHMSRHDPKEVISVKATEDLSTSNHQQVVIASTKEGLSYLSNIYLPTTGLEVIKVF